MEGIEKMDNYLKYEEDCSRIRESNKTLLTHTTLREQPCEKIGMIRQEKSQH